MHACCQTSFLHVSFQPKLISQVSLRPKRNSVSVHLTNFLPFRYFVPVLQPTAVPQQSLSSPSAVPQQSLSSPSAVPQQSLSSLLAVSQQSLSTLSTPVHCKVLMKKNSRLGFSPNITHMTPTEWPHMCKKFRNKQNLKLQLGSESTVFFLF